MTSVGSAAIPKNSLPLPKGNSLHCQNLLEKLLSGRKSWRNLWGIQSILGKRAKWVTSERTSQKHNVADNMRSEQAWSIWYGSLTEGSWIAELSTERTLMLLYRKQSKFFSSSVIYSLAEKTNFVSYKRIKFLHMLIRRLKKKKNTKHFYDFKKLFESHFFLLHVTLWLVVSQSLCKTRIQMLNVFWFWWKLAHMSLK